MMREERKMAKRRELVVSREDVPWISIGRRGTYNTQEIIFDFSVLKAEFGEGIFQLLFVRPGESESQPIANITVPVTITENKAIWNITDHDTEKTGNGVGQIVYRGDGFCYKTNVFQIAVTRGINK